MDQHGGHRLRVEVEAVFGAARGAPLVQRPDPFEWHFCGDACLRTVLDRGGTIALPAPSA